MPLVFRLFVCLALSTALVRAEEAPVSPQALAQIQALQAEKESRSLVQEKIASQLLYAVKVQRGEHLGTGLEAMEARIKGQANGLVLVDLSAAVNANLLTAIKGLGGRIVSSTPAYGEVRAQVPLTAVEALAALPGVTSVRPGAPSFTHAGSVQSQGDVAMKADQMRALTKATGRGVKVGVLSDSVDFLGSSQATGDLGPVTVLPGLANIGGGNGEGTAMLEIVHDLAPDAELFFASANLGEGSFAQSILDLRKAGCDIIIDDLSYIDEPPFQDGIIARAVNEVSNDGVLYFSAEGNEGSVNAGTSGTWEGDFVDGGATTAPITTPGRVHRFGQTNWNTITGSGQFTLLNWSDPLGKSRNDYDLYLLDSTGTQVLDASTNVQNGTQDPIEGFYTSTAGGRIVVVKANDAAPRYLRVTSYRGELTEHTSYSVFGHAAAEKAIGVAAVDASAGAVFTTASPAEYFSSDGPRRIFYYEDGSQVTQGNLSATGGLLRPSPLLAAADGVQTSVPNFPWFYGTSAAAPHAGAVAALVWSRNRSLSRQQVFDAMAGTALDIGPAGFDNTSGYGLVDAQAAAASVAGTPLLALAGSTIESESFAPANARLDPGEQLGFSVTLRNDGPVATSNLTATLVSADGVTLPSPTVTYGVIASGGTATRSFSFRAAQALGKAVSARLDLADSGVSLGSITVSFATGLLGAPQSYSNSAPILINDQADASPYPATVNVSGFSGILGKVTATLNGFTHTFPGDTGFLLVAPGGQASLLMETAGGGLPVVGVNVTLDDDATASVPFNDSPAGTWRPAQYYDLLAAYSFSAPAPAAPYAVSLAGLTGSAPNGDWKLFGRDSFAGDSGVLAGGFTVNLYPITAVTSSAAASLAASVTADRSSVAVGEVATLTAHVFNFGGATATGASALIAVPGNFRILSAVSDLGSVAVSAQTASLTLPALASEGVATVTLQVEAEATGFGKATVTAASDVASLTLTAAYPNLAPASGSALAVANAAGQTTGLRSTDFLSADLAYSNTGGAAARANFFVDLYLDGLLLRRLDHRLPLMPGASRHLTGIPLGRIAPGKHTLMVQLDGDSEIVESNKGDNSIVSAFTVIAVGPNLAFTGNLGLANMAGAQTDSALLTSADTIYYRIPVANTGNVSTGASTTATVYLDQAAAVTLSVPALAPGASTTLMGSVPTLAGGAHTLGVVLDAGGLVTETNEDDNVASRNFVINGLPQISTPGNLSTSEGMPVDVSFTVGDAETAPEQLLVSFVSSNPGLLSADRFVIGGSGTARTVKLIPTIYASGTATVTITVDDQNGGRAAGSFEVTVTPVNDLPAITPVADVRVPKHGSTAALPFLVSDQETSASQLYVTADSSNPAVVPVSGILLSGFGTQRAVTITPADHVTGASLITLTVSDGTGSASVSFHLTVTPVNDPPSFTLQPRALAAKDAGAQRVPHFATEISPGGPDEAAQRVSFTTVAGTPGLFTIQPALAADGALTFTPSPIASGSTIVTVIAQDDAGGVAPTRTFTLTITSAQEEAGSYHGLIVPAAPLSAERAGAVSLLMTAGGAASGKVVVGARTVPFRAVVTNTGAVRFVPGGPTLQVAPLLWLSLQVDVSDSTGSVTGVLATSAGGSAGTVLAERDFYRPGNSVPPTLTGDYTAALALETGGAGLPTGKGSARVHLNAFGNIAIAGRLPDGAAFSAGGYLSFRERWPLYRLLYSGRGSLSGWIQLQPGTPRAAEAPSLLWFRPAARGLRQYAAGWPEGLKLDLSGS